MREEAYPLSIRVIHSHVPHGGQGMPCIRGDGDPLVMHRSGPGTTPATSILFTWCDGYQSTIQDAVRRLVRHSVDVRDLVLYLVKNVGRMFSDEDVTFAATLSWLVSYHGAQLANEQLQRQESINTMRRQLTSLRKSLETYRSSSLDFQSEKESETGHGAEHASRRRVDVVG
jgi:hypothetical protein